MKRRKHSKRLRPVQLPITIESATASSSKRQPEPKPTLAEPSKERQSAHELIVGIGRLQVAVPVVSAALLLLAAFAPDSQIDAAVDDIESILRLRDRLDDSGWLNPSPPWLFEYVDSFTTPTGTTVPTPRLEDRSFVLLDTPTGKATVELVHDSIPSLVVVDFEFPHRTPLFGFLSRPDVTRRPIGPSNQHDSLAGFIEMWNAMNERRAYVPKSLSPRCEVYELRPTRADRKLPEVADDTVYSMANNERVYPRAQLLRSATPESAIAATVRLSIAGLTSEDFKRWEGPENRPRHVLSGLLRGERSDWLSDVAAERMELEQQLLQARANLIGAAELSSEEWDAQNARVNSIQERIRVYCGEGEVLRFRIPINCDRYHLGVQSYLSDLAHADWMPGKFEDSFPALADKIGQSSSLTLTDCLDQLRSERLREGREIPVLAVTIPGSAIALVGCFIVAAAPFWTMIQVRQLREFTIQELESGRFNWIGLSRDLPTRVLSSVLIAILPCLAAAVLAAQQIAWTCHAQSSNIFTRTVVIEVATQRSTVAVGIVATASGIAAWLLIREMRTVWKRLGALS